MTKSESIAVRMASLATISIAIVLGTAPVVPAWAELTRAVVTDSGSMGTFGGRQYTWVRAAMEGTVARDDGTTGHYRVPITLYYPDRGSNGFGFVDVVNPADFHYWTDETAPYGKRKVYYTGDTIFSDHLRQEGFTYISVQWSRMVTEELGPNYGVIENGMDGYEIVADAARLLRGPDKLEGALTSSPGAVGRVIGHGQSGGAGLLRAMVWLGENRDNDGGLIFDGLILRAVAFSTTTIPRSRHPG